MNTTIFFAGTGNMGGAILRGLLNAGTDAKNIFFFDPSDKAAEAVSALGCVQHHGWCRPQEPHRSARRKEPGAPRHAELAAHRWQGFCGPRH